MWFSCSDDDCRYETNSGNNARNHELETGHEMINDNDWEFE